MPPPASDPGTPRRLARLLARLCEGLPRIAVVGFGLPAPGRHPIGKVFRGTDHRDTPLATPEM
jgi:hypothetical protein